MPKVPSFPLCFPLADSSKQTTGQREAAGGGFVADYLSAQKKTPTQKRNKEHVSQRERPFFVFPKQGLSSKGADTAGVSHGARGIRGRGDLLIICMALRPLGASSPLGSGPSEPSRLPSGYFRVPCTNPDPTHGSRPCQDHKEALQAPWPALLLSFCHTALTLGQVH